MDLLRNEEKRHARCGSLDLSQTESVQNSAEMHVNVKDITENSFYHHSDMCLITPMTKVITTTAMTSFHMYILITSPN